MTPSQFSTLGLPARDQFAAWCGWFEPVFDLMSPAGGPDAGFAGEIKVWSLGKAALSRVRAPQLHAVRGAHNLRRDQMDHWNIAIGGRDTRLTRRGATVTIPAGTPFIISLGEACGSEREADDRLQLYLPRDQFASLAPVLDRLRGVPLTGPSGRLLADYLLLIERSLPDLTAEDLPCLADAITAMVAACAAPLNAGPDLAQEQVDVTRLERVRHVIRRRLHSATLTAAALCRETGMSRSQLYRLLEGEGGVVRYIQRLRLQASYAALADPCDSRSVAAIGEACGFYDPSTFSRAFRREFGMTPSDLRIACRGGVPLAGIAGAVMPAETWTLTSCLRRM